ncbi:hypothetical protein MMC13_002220 [Lambiella insularis]|nr:hypothetical protein [Lambiella insularis]
MSFSLSNNMGEVIRDHLLAASIIARHNTPNDILDDSELSILEDFCADPTRKDAVMRDHGVLIDPVGKNSLAGYCVSRHGTENPAFLDEEIEMLRAWFGRGGRKEGGMKLNPSIPPSSISSSTMLLIGLTGSIATGKSTVSALLSKPPYSLPIIDADLLARQVVEPGTHGYHKILAHFASTTPDLLLPADNDSPPSLATGTSASARGRPLNRPALGRRVFGSTPSRVRDRAVLNGIVHPAVRRAMLFAVLKYYLAGHWAVVLDIPLLFESGLDVFCGYVIVVGVSDPVIQMQRLRARDPHLSEKEAGERVQSQGDLKGKVRRVRCRGDGWGEVVWNDGGKEELSGEVERVLGMVERESPRWWGWVLWGCPPLAGLLGAWCMVRGWWARRKWQTSEKEVGKADEVEDSEGKAGRDRAKL